MVPENGKEIRLTEEPSSTGTQTCLSSLDVDEILRNMLAFFRLLSFWAGYGVHG